MLDLDFRESLSWMLIASHFNGKCLGVPRNPPEPYALWGMVSGTGEMGTGKQNNESTNNCIYYRTATVNS